MALNANIELFRFFVFFFVVVVCLFVLFCFSWGGGGGGGGVRFLSSLLSWLFEHDCMDACAVFGVYFVHVFYIMASVLVHRLEMTVTVGWALNTNN